MSDSDTFSASVTSNSERFAGEIPIIPNAPFDFLKIFKMHSGNLYELALNICAALSGKTNYTRFSFKKTVRHLW